MRTTQLISHPKLNVEMKTGSEGPLHDPYSYQELHVSTPLGEVVVHEGLGEWIKFNGDKLDPPKWIRKVKGDITTHERIERAWREDQFEQHTGYSREDLERIHRKLSSRCRCGCKSFHYESGFPGETFECCDSCGRVHSTSMNWSAIE